MSLPCQDQGELALLTGGQLVLTEGSLLYPWLWGSSLEEKASELSNGTLILLVDQSAVGGRELLGNGQEGQEHRVLLVAADQASQSM